MKKTTVLIIAIILFSLNGIAQITKGNWMVGGSTSYTKSEYNQDNTPSIITITNSINLSPNVGYFFIDKLCIGTIYQYSSSISKIESGKRTYKSNNIGPFIRYYILKPEKVTNIFLETSYNFSTVKDNKNTILNSKLGVVYFLNSSIGFELALNYSINKYVYDSELISDSTSKNLLLGLGFQIHLEKE